MESKEESKEIDASTQTIEREKQMKADNMMDTCERQQRIFLSSEMLNGDGVKLTLSHRDSK